MNEYDIRDRAVLIKKRSYCMRFIYYAIYRKFSF